MNKNVFLSVLISGLKYSILIVAATGLFSMVPVDIVYYLLNLQRPFNGRADALPLEWLCATSLVIAATYLIPVVAGGAALASAIGFYQTRISKRLDGHLFGAIFGAVFFVIGTESFLNLTQERDLENWIFWTAMICWGSVAFAWLGHRIEALYASRMKLASWSTQR